MHHDGVLRLVEQGGLLADLQLRLVALTLHFAAEHIPLDGLVTDGDQQPERSLRHHDHHPRKPHPVQAEQQQRHRHETQRRQRRDHDGDCWPEKHQAAAEDQRPEEDQSPVAPGGQCMQPILAHQVQQDRGVNVHGGIKDRVGIPRRVGTAELILALAQQAGLRATADDHDLVMEVAGRLVERQLVAHALEVVRAVVVVDPPLAETRRVIRRDRQLQQAGGGPGETDKVVVARAVVVLAHEKILVRLELGESPPGRRPGEKLMRHGQREFPLPARAVGHR